ncbi:DUF4190 domain-containing protein [Streptomyces sp. NPDC029003]|uniref:DUF4190 domain-containing protein n=1 Tax=Streptomyces sp. NPDC029003 TaxID=3155125 RepID=UPI003409A119
MDTTTPGTRGTRRTEVPPHPPEYVPHHITQQYSEYSVPRYGSPAGAPGRNGPAVAALALGITGALTSVVLIGGPLGLIGLVLGVIGLRTAGRTGVGRSMAIAALVTSFLAVMVSVLMAIGLVWYADHTQKCYRPDSLRQYTQCVHEQLGRA